MKLNQISQWVAVELQDGFSTYENLRPYVFDFSIIFVVDLPSTNCSDLT